VTAFGFRSLCGLPNRLCAPLLRLGLNFVVFQQEAGPLIPQWLFFISPSVTAQEFRFISCSSDDSRFFGVAFFEVRISPPPVELVAMFFFRITV